MERSTTAWMQRIWHESRQPRDLWRNGKKCLEIADAETEDCIMFYDICISSESNPIRKFDLINMRSYILNRFLGTSQNAEWRELRENGIGLLPAPSSEIEMLRSELEVERAARQRFENEFHKWRDRTVNAESHIVKQSALIRSLAPAKRYVDAINVQRVAEGKGELHLPQEDSLAQIEEDYQFTS